MTQTTFRLRPAGLLILTMLALLPGAHASVVFVLNQDGCTDTCGTGPFGTIEVTQITSTQLSIVETLALNERFAGTNAGDALEFNFDLPFTMNILTPGFAVGPAPDTASTFGTFLQSITCTDCHGGQSDNPVGPLIFTITSAGGLSISDFVANAGGYYFASDIVGNNGKTGNVAANSFTTLTPPPSTPEPFTTGLVAAGLLGIRFIHARRRRKNL